MLFVFSVLTLVLELNALIKGKIEILQLESLEEEDPEGDIEDLLDEEDTSLTMLRMLKKKKKGGPGSFDAAGYYESEPWQHWIRVSYCILCLLGALKVLNVAQFNEKIAFLVKILSKVANNLLPFVLLWFAI